MTPALGTQRYGTGRRPVTWGRRAVVIFDDETFDRIRQLALNDGVSFAEQVRILVQWGMDSAEAGRPGAEG